MASKAMTVFRANGEDYTINDPNIAVEFSASNTYKKGDFVNYQGNLYRFTADHAAGTTWADSSKKLVKVSDLIGESEKQLGSSTYDGKGYGDEIHVLMNIKEGYKIEDGEIVFEPGFVNGKLIRIRSDYVAFDNMFATISVDEGYLLVLISEDQEGNQYERGILGKNKHVYFGKNIQNVFVLGKLNEETQEWTGEIEIGDEKHFTIRKEDGDRWEDLGAGIKQYKPNYGIDESISFNSLYFSGTNPESHHMCSDPMTIPEGGLRITFNPKYNTKEYLDTPNQYVPYFRIVAVKKGDNGLVAQDDDDDVLAASQTEIALSESVYIPYIKDCYLILIGANRNMMQDVDFSDFFVITGGKIHETGGKMYNVFPTAVRVVTSGEENVLDVFGSPNVSYLTTSSRFIGTIVRIRDVNRVICGPMYSMVAEIHKINDDMTTSKEDQVFGNFPVYSSSDTKLSGVPVIDFSEYDYDGFALVAIQAPVIYKRNPNSSTPEMRYLSMGGLTRYEDVMNSVFVEYKNGVEISYVKGMPQIIRENIRQLCDWQIPVLGAGAYTDQGSTVSHAFNPMYDYCMGSMYNGTFVANTLLMNVTAKSAMTCAQNPNGRMRKMQRESGERGNIGFGITCTNMTSIIRGLKENYTSDTYAHGDNIKFDRYDFDYTKDMDILRPGDILTMNIHEPDPVSGRESRSHCMTVSSIVYINGVLAAVNIFEASGALNRYNTFINLDYFDTENNWIANVHSIKKLADYKWINRIKPQYLKRITDTYDLHPEDTTVGTVMCDRGTDSLYGVNTEYIELSVTDSAASNLRLYKDGTQIATIYLSGVETVNGARLINIIEYVNGAGEYTVKTNRSDTVQERFYIQGNVAEATDVEGETEVTLTMPDMSNLVFLEVWYGIRAEVIRSTRVYVPEQFEVDESTDVGTLTIPRYVDEKEVSGFTRIYETEHGTYHCGLSGQVSTEYYGIM